MLSLLPLTGSQGCDAVLTAQPLSCTHQRDECSTGLLFCADKADPLQTAQSDRMCHHRQN
jgi:hypothetical protein